MLILQLLDFSRDSGSSSRRGVEVEALEVDGEFEEGR